MTDSKSTPVRIAIPILIGVGGLLSMTLIAQFLQNGTLPMWKISSYAIVNSTFTMQMMVLPISLIAIAFIYFYDRQGFKTFFRVGITFSKDNEWSVYGPMVAVGFTIGTMMLLSFSVISQHGAFNETFVALLPLVLLMSLTNAWSEEIFSRFVLAAGLSERLNPATIGWISAIIFGLPHFLGTPSGVFGVIVSGFLGWVLAKSVLETRGLGWAVLIHFLQDVVIFGSGAMIIAGQNK